MYDIPAPINFKNKDPHNGLWVGIFGSLVNQKQNHDNYGYYAKASGGIYGIERMTKLGSMYGLAYATSNSNLFEDNQNRTVRLLGYHLMLYGTTTLASQSYFMDWLLTGLMNKNVITTYTTPGGQHSSYRTSQMAAKITLGQSTDNDYWQFSLLETVSYSALYQQDYITHNSSAAINYNPKRFSNLFTAGGGFAISLPKSYPWLRGTSMIRLLGTYDVVRTIKETTANFLNGVENFTLSSAPSRWAFLVGARYAINCRCIQIEASYNFELRNNYTDNAGELKLKLLF